MEPWHVIAGEPLDHQVGHDFEDNSTTLARNNGTSGSADDLTLYNTPTLYEGNDVPACRQNLFGFSKQSGFFPDASGSGALQSHRFDGGNDYLAVPNIWSSPTEGAISVRFKSYNSTTEQRIVAHNDDGVYAVIRINNSANNRIEGKVSDGTVNHGVAIDSYDVTKWHEAVVRWQDNGNVELIVDGDSAGTVGIGGPSGEVAGPGITIGSNRVHSAQWFSGQIADVKFYDDWDMTTLAACYPLDGDLFDYSGNGNHLTAHYGSELVPLQSRQSDDRRTW